MDARQPVLIDMTPYLDTTGTVFEAIADTEAELAAEEAAQAAEEAARAERDAVAIRAMIGATLPTGAADRIRATFGATTDTSADLVAAVREYALAHYAQGWDVVVECRTDAELADMIGDAATAEEAVEEVAEWVGLAAESRSNTASGDDVEEELDVDALGLSPSMRRMLVELHTPGARWHAQSRLGLVKRGLIVEVGVSPRTYVRTELGERVLAAL